MACASKRQASVNMRGLNMDKLVNGHGVMTDREDCIKLKACTEAARDNGLTALPCKTCRCYIPRPDSKNAKNYQKGVKMSNQLSDLNNSLFAQLDRLNNNDLTGDALSIEITRAKAICNVSTEIIKTADLSLKAHTALNTGIKRPAPKMLGVSDE